MPETVQPGRLLDGRYLLIERIGNGGMSTVWRARDERLGRIAAVKILSAESLADPAARERLRTEAQALARLQHPHIADVYDYSIDDVPFLVMELVDGVPLTQALADGRRLPWVEAVSICAQTAAALATAHRRGVVHRDVAAGNILLTADGVKVIDFGICAPEGNLEADTLLGTPAYLAPERIKGHPVQPESDVYALGVLLYRMLSGTFPFFAATARDLMLAHRDHVPPHLPILDGIPPVVVEVCMRCLTKDPADRPAAAEVSRTLFDLLGGGVTIPVPAPAAADDGMSTRLLPWPDGRRPAPQPPVPVRQPASRRLPGRARVIVVAAGAVLVAGAAWTVNGWDSVPATSPPAAAGPGPSAAPVTCEVTYQTVRDTGTAFRAVVTVANIGNQGITDGRLTFDLPPTHHILADSLWQQDGRTVTTAPGLLNLPSGSGVRLPLSGAYTGAVAYPVTFRLDGLPCTASVWGPGGVPVVVTSPGPSHPPVVVVDLPPAASAAPAASPQHTPGEPGGSDQPPPSTEPTATGTPVSGGGGPSIAPSRSVPARPSPTPRGGETQRV